MLFCLSVPEEWYWSIRCFQFAGSSLPKAFAYPGRHGDSCQVSGLCECFFLRAVDADL